MKFRCPDCGRLVLDIPIEDEEGGGCIDDDCPYWDCPSHTRRCTESVKEESDE